MLWCFVLFRVSMSAPGPFRPRPTGQEKPAYRPGESIPSTLNRSYRLRYSPTAQIST